MKFLRLLATLGLLCTAPAFAGTDSTGCSPRMLAGRWMFATDVGKQSFFPGGDITAIGTFWIDRQGTVTNGEFDATVADFGFLHGIKFSGSLVLNPDCTGTFTFTTSAGTTRTDTIIVLGPGHVRAMSQDVQFLWTYDMHRL